MRKGLIVFQTESNSKLDKEEFVDQLGQSVDLGQYRHIAVVGKSSLDCCQALLKLRSYKPQTAQPAFESDLVQRGYSLKSHQIERLRSFGASHWDICGYSLEAEIMCASFLMYDAGLGLTLLVPHTFSQTDEQTRSSLLNLYQQHFGAGSLAF